MFAVEYPVTKLPPLVFGEEVLCGIQANENLSIVTEFTR